MNRMTGIARALLAATVAALALTAAATAGGPGLSSGLGCSVACIERAVVTPTASSATVQVKTSVPASVTVKVTKFDAALGLAAAPAPRDIVVPAFQTIRTVLVHGLEPATKYRIVVSARDTKGQKQIRSGAFTTRAVKVAVGTPDVGLSAGLGCKADCIEKGTLTSDPSIAGRARLELESSVPATFQVKLVAKNGSHQLIHSTGSRATTHSATINGLLTGTTYVVTARATDAAGRTHSEQGTFRTRSAKAIVTYHKVHVMSDADWGPDRGEVSFGFSVDGLTAGWMGFRKIGSGDTVAVTAPGSSRPGLLFQQSIDGLSMLELQVTGIECDALLMKNCFAEVGHTASGEYGNLLYVTTTASVDLREAFVPGGLPGNYGTGLPAGHDGYVVWETTQYDLQYRVYATVDIEVS